MKKVVLIGLVCFAFVLTGCNLICKATNKTPEELHNEAVQKVTEYAEKLAIDKIDKSEDLTDKAKAELKVKVAKLREEIVAKIQQLHDEAMARKEAKKAAKAAAKINDSVESGMAASITENVVKK